MNVLSFLVCVETFSPIYMYITAIKCSESKRCSKHCGFFVTASARAAEWSTCLIHTARYTGLSVFHFTRGRCTTLMRWHFEIYFSLLPPNIKTFPPRVCLHSSAPPDWQAAPWASGGVRASEEIRSFHPLSHLPQARKSGMWESGSDGGGVGTGALAAPVEMAVSIKYHFQFPCFMILGLLSTNNPSPSAARPSYLVLRKIDYTCRLL